MKKLIVIGGATASGKTAWAIDVAKHFSTEIISADSRQCYQELNIGVAKPSQEELESVKHHFINSHSIHQEVSAGEYERYALQAMHTIFENNDYAVCVGGTGLYIKALCEGIDEMPKVDELVKQEITHQYEKNGLIWLQKEVQKNDPNFFAQAEQDNPMRLLRALIFYKSQGESILNFRSKSAKERNFEVYYFAKNIQRDLLYERINIRVDTMMYDGLLEEVKTLKSFEHLNSLKTVGYQELFDYLNGHCTLENAIDKIKQHTRNYAKRQLTWIRHQQNFLLVDDFKEIIDTAEGSNKDKLK